MTDKDKMGEWKTCADCSNYGCKYNPTVGDTPQYYECAKMRTEAEEKLVEYEAKLMDMNHERGDLKGQIMDLNADNNKLLMVISGAVKVTKEDEDRIASLEAHKKHWILMYKASLVQITEIEAKLKEKDEIIKKDELWHMCNGPHGDCDNCSRPKDGCDWYKKYKKDVSKPSPGERAGELIAKMILDDQKPEPNEYEWICYECGKVEKDNVPFGGNIICDECYAKNPEEYSPPEKPKPTTKPEDYPSNDVDAAHWGGEVRMPKKPPEDDKCPRCGGNGCIITGPGEKDVDGCGYCNGTGKKVKK